MSAPLVYRFGSFEFDPAALTLRGHGVPIPLERRPAELLSLLVSEAGRLVTREAIAVCLWPHGIHVETDLGLNTAMRKLRQALGDPADRPAIIKTVPRRGYRFIAGCEAPARRLLIAVFAFADLTPDHRARYLADGLTEETIVRLGQVDRERLAVVGRSTVAALARAASSPADLRSQFGIDYLVESSLLIEHERLRVVCKLVDTRDGRQVWAETYDGAPSRILDFQDKISRTIATRIRLHLTPARARLVARRQSENPIAFDLYLRGRYLFNQNTRVTNGDAIALYRRAVSLDPCYALAWSGLAETLAVNPVNGDVEPARVHPDARDAARRAVESGPELAETYAARGFVRFWLEWDWTGAESDFRQSASLDPNYAFARRMLSVVLSHAGRHGEASEAIRLACELDPHLPMHHALASQVAFQARDFAAAAEHARHAIVLAPGFWIGHHMLAQTCERQGDVPGALTAADTAIALTGGNAKTFAVKGFALARAGQREAARAILAERAAISAVRYVPPFTEALVNAGLGEVEAAFQALERALSVRDVNLAFLPCDPKWDEFRGPRLDAVIARAGLHQDGFLHPAATTSSDRRHTPEPANDESLSV